MHLDSVEDAGEKLIDKSDYNSLPNNDESCRSDVEDKLSTSQLIVESRDHLDARQGPSTC